MSIFTAARIVLIIEFCKSNEAIRARKEGNS